jgi:uncharacterized protein (TIGR03437 family)
MKLRPFVLSVLIFVSASFPSFAQNLVCTAGAVAKLVRSEGVAEKMGDVVLSCQGGTPGLAVTGNLSISLTVPVTNRLTATTGDIIVTVNTGSGPVSVSYTPQLITPQTVSLNGISFTTPASGGATLIVSNLRGNASAALPNQSITAFLAFNGFSTVAIQNNQPVVAVPQKGLLAINSSTTIRCVGSPLPATIGVTNFFAAGTHFESTRLTEGFATAFQPQGAMEDFGTRFIVRYTNVPAGVMLWIPDAIAGSDAAQPTAGGDLDKPQAVGQYVPGSNTLLLTRVDGADSTGNGGAAVAATFDKATQLSVTGGTAYVVYEVRDANPTVQESAQFPTFVGLASTGVAAGQAQESVSFAPVANSSATPIPRFIASAPPSDCQALQDCNASYFPVLVVPTPASIQFTAFVGGLPFERPGYIAVQNANANQSILNWTASVTYQSGSGWLTLTPNNGLNNGTVRVDGQPQNLAAGTYNALITIDGGVAGVKNVPVVLLVNALPPVTPPVVTPPPIVTPPPAVVPGVTSVTNAANRLPGPVVSGSIATISGTKFTAKTTLSVTFDGVSATVLFSSDTQINVLVPDGVAGKTAAQVVVTVDGSSSPATPVSLAAVSPAIFTNGILNPDYSVNNATNGALVGSNVVILVTGLPESIGTVLVKIHDRDGLVPVSAGPLDGNPGVQQVTVAVPSDLPAMTTQAEVCGTDSAGNLVCSAPAPITLTTPPDQQ